MKMPAIGYRVFGLLPKLVRHWAIRIVYPTFTAGAVCAIVDRERGDGTVDADVRLLLVKHSYVRRWSMPGGLVDRDEEPTETIRREMREELGVELEIHAGPLVEMGDSRRHLDFVYRATLSPADVERLGPNSPEITAVDWFALDQLPELADGVVSLAITAGIPLEPNPEDAAEAPR